MGIYIYISGENILAICFEVIHGDTYGTAYGTWWYIDGDHLEAFWLLEQSASGERCSASGEQ